MEQHSIQIQTALGPHELHAVLVETKDGWTANLLPRPGDSMSGSSQGATPEEALANLAAQAQRQYDEQVEAEVKLYGHVPGA